MPIHPREVMLLSFRISAQLTRIPVNLDDPASIRKRLLEGRHVIERELWPYREHWQAIAMCREIWSGALDHVLADPDRAGLTAQECGWLRQWQPMPGIGAFHFPELAR